MLALAFFASIPLISALLLTAGAGGRIVFCWPLLKFERWAALASFAQLAVPIISAVVVVRTYDYDYYLFRSARDQAVGYVVLVLPLAFGIPLFRHAGRMKLAVALNCLASICLASVFLILSSTADKDF